MFKLGKSKTLNFRGILETKARKNHETNEPGKRVEPTRLRGMALVHATKEEASPALGERAPRAPRDG